MDPTCHGSHAWASLVNYSNISNAGDLAEKYVHYCIIYICEEKNQCQCQQGVSTSTSCAQLFPLLRGKFMSMKAGSDLRPVSQPITSGTTLTIWRSFCQFHHVSLKVSPSCRGNVLLDDVGLAALNFPTGPKARLVGTLLRAMSELQRFSCATGDRIVDMSL